mmetsp:Transcript_1921/g.6874  ORF Transcript_1921/g.6874 Transcript_1921/m.6874 type:complete len:101 (-) Transcript_1921:408-710(-)
MMPSFECDNALCDEECTTDGINRISSIKSLPIRTCRLMFLFSYDWPTHLHTFVVTIPTLVCIYWLVFSKWPTVDFAALDPVDPPPATNPPVPPSLPYKYS